MPSNSTRATAPGKSTSPQVSAGCQKPAKPNPDFPLFPHASGRWAKKIRGKLVYFGSWSAGADAALEKYLAQKDDLHAGKKPRAANDALTVKGLVNAFLDAKEALRDEGRIAGLTWGDYKTACDEIIAAFGKGRLAADLRPDDFGDLRKRMAQKWGLQRLCKNIQFIRCVFKWGYDSERLDRPLRFGPDFKRPAKKEFRIQRAKAGLNLFTREEVLAMLDAATGQLRAMLLLGVNCGFGNADCGTLPVSAIDFATGIIDYPRPKTGIARRCPLWPETIQAIEDVLASRPPAKNPDHAGLVFITRCGDSWHTGTNDGPLSREVGKLLRKLGINGRKGLGFYTCRHVFRTKADEAKDQPAADHIMGHESPHMSSTYRETIAVSRLRAVSDHVRQWLFGKEGGAACKQ